MAEPDVVASGTVVTMHYTLRDGEGEILDSSAGSEPLAYLHGADNIVPGLERQLTGKRVGDSFTAVVPPEEAFGEREGSPQPIDRSAFAGEGEIEPGMQVIAEGRDGQSFPLWIVEVGESEVLVDANHPLAGVTLHFDVEITGLRAASDDEKERGRPQEVDEFDA